MCTDRVAVVHGITSRMASAAETGPVDMDDLEQPRESDAGPEAAEPDATSLRALSSAMKEVTNSVSSSMRSGCAILCFVSVGAIIGLIGGTLMVNARGSTVPTETAAYDACLNLTCLAAADATSACAYIAYSTRTSTCMDVVDNAPGAAGINCTFESPGMQSCTAAMRSHGRALEGWGSAGAVSMVIVGWTIFGVGLLLGIGFYVAPYVSSVVRMRTCKAIARFWCCCDDEAAYDPVGTTRWVERHAKARAAIDGLRDLLATGRFGDTDSVRRHRDQCIIGLSQRGQMFRGGLYLVILSEAVAAGRLAADDADLAKVVSDIVKRAEGCMEGDISSNRFDFPDRMRAYIRESGLRMDDE